MHFSLPHHLWRCQFAEGRQLLPPLQLPLPCTAWCERIPQVPQSARRSGSCYCPVRARRPSAKWHCYKQSRHAILKQGVFCKHYKCVTCSVYNDALFQDGISGLTVTSSTMQAAGAASQLYAASPSTILVKSALQAAQHTHTSTNHSKSF